MDFARSAHADLNSRIAFNMGGGFHEIRTRAHHDDDLYRKNDPIIPIVEVRQI